MRRAAAVTPTGAAVEFAFLERTTDLTLTSGSLVTLTGYQTALDSATMDADAAGGTITPTVTGLYAIYGEWDATATFAADGLIRLNVGADVSGTLWNCGASAWNRKSFASEAFISVTGIARLTALPGPDNAFDITVSQQSGVDRTLNNARFIVVKLA